jgi:predicted DNA-binding protein with PD1-like motif
MLMKARQYEFGRVFLGRLAHKSDLTEAITTFCADNGLNAGFVSAIGALTMATIGFYDQDDKTYKTILIEEPVELASLTGNVSLKDGKPMVHAHVVLSRESGESIAGHLMSPSIVFAGEVFGAELRGEPLAREFDETTGLTLWGALA